MKLEIIQDQTTDTFLREAGGLLYQNEAVNALMLGLCLSWKPSDASPEIRLFRIVQNGKTVSAAVQTPPYNLILTYGTEAQLNVLARFFHDRGFGFPGVVGPSREATYFAETWASLNNITHSIGMTQKIYQANKTILPDVKGKLREALPQDEELIAQWLYEFSAESLPEKEKFSLTFAREGAKKAIESKQGFLWLVGDRPVSMAHTGRPTKNGISIRAVYTPPEARKRGYGSVIVAHLTQRMLERGFSFCCLYTDALNPTSNKIYQDIGYREVEDSNHFIFENKTPAPDL